MNLTSKPCSTSSRPAVYRTACEKACALSPLSATLANSAPASPFFATLTDNSQVAENTATLSPFPAHLSATVNNKSFVCLSFKKQGGCPPFAPARFPVPRSFPTFKRSNFQTFQQSSHPIRNGPFHPLEKEQPPQQNQNHHRSGRQQQRPGRLAVPRQRPAKTVNHPRHGVQPVQPPPPLRHQRARIRHRRSKHPELHEKRHHVTHIAIKRVQRRHP